MVSIAEDEVTATGMRGTWDQGGGSNGINRLLDRFPGERLEETWPGSEALFTLVLRKRAVDCGPSDREFAQLAAIRAIERGRNVFSDADLLENR